MLKRSTRLTTGVITSSNVARCQHAQLPSHSRRAHSAYPDSRGSPARNICAARACPIAASHQTAPPPSPTAPSPSGPTQDYLVYVVCESADKLVLLRFGPHGFQIEHETHIGLLPVDINGPHGIAVSPDKQFVYVSVGHGRPDGSAWKLKAGSDEVVKYTPLGLFPATADISKDGEFLYVANANFHGDMVPSSISVVATEAMLEVKRITTCTMPHGSRLSPDGTKHYSACMMDDMLAEIDTRKFAVSRYFVVSVGKEMGMQGAPAFANENGRPLLRAHLGAAFQRRLGNLRRVQ